MVVYVIARLSCQGAARDLWGALRNQWLAPLLSVVRPTENGPDTCKAKGENLTKRHTP